MSTNKKTRKSTAQVARDFMTRVPGAYLFPIKAGVKDKPLLKKNLELAFNDAPAIDAWAGKAPGCNWGLAIKKSGMIVMDVDTKPGKAGKATLDMLELNNGPLPATLTVRTPSGGLHYYYKETPTVRHVMRVSGFGPDIDSTNYVLIPGCALDSGGSYTIITDAPIADAPAWFAEVLVAAEPVEDADQTPLVEQDTPTIRARCIEYLKTDAPLAKIGSNGDAVTLRVAGTLKDLGASEIEALELMRDYWNDRCDPPWSISEGPTADRLDVKVHNAWLYLTQNAPGSAAPEADFKEPADPLTGEAAEAAAEGEREEAELKSSKARWAKVLDAHVLCLSPVAFIERDNKVALGPGQIDAAFNHIINRLPLAPRYKDHAAKLAIGSPEGIKRVDAMCYRPGRPDICIETVSRPGKPPRQVEKFNMWIDPCVEPLDGSPMIFREHMRYLIPDQRERIIFLDWLSHLVQHPDQKIMYAVLIVGLERTGKSWLGYMLRKMLGFDNVAMVGDEDPIGDTFNGWTENKLLGVIHELAPNPKVDLVARVKPVITEPTIQVNEKYIKRHVAENACHILAISNHDTAVKMLRNNPRWLVIRAADDPQGVDDDGQATPAFDAYYKRLWDSIGPLDDATPTDEVRRTLGWLRRRDVSKFIRSIAPATETRNEIADAGGSDVANQVNDLYRNRLVPFLPGRTLVTPAEVADCLDARRERDLKDNPLALLNVVTAAMTALGCRKVTDKVRVGGDQGVRLWSTSRKLADKYKPMADAAVAAIYKRERAAAKVKLDQEAIEQAAGDFA